MCANFIESIILSKACFDSIEGNELFDIFWIGNGYQVFNFFYFLIICIIDEISSSIIVLKVSGLNLS